MSARSVKTLWRVFNEKNFKIFDRNEIFALNYHQDRQKTTRLENMELEWGINVNGRLILSLEMALATRHKSFRVWWWWRCGETRCGAGFFVPATWRLAWAGRVQEKRRPPEIPKLPDLPTPGTATKKQNFSRVRRANELSTREVNEKLAKQAQVQKNK